MTAAEWKRKAIHAGIGLFALTLRWLDWRLAAACAVAALLANVILLPRFARGIYRDPSARHDAGIVAYPAMVALLVGMGFRAFSMAAAAVPMVKQKLHAVDSREAAAVARRALREDSADGVRALLAPLVEAMRLAGDAVAISKDAVAISKDAAAMSKQEQ